MLASFAVVAARKIISIYSVVILDATNNDLISVWFLQLLSASILVNKNRNRSRQGLCNFSQQEPKRNVFQKCTFKIFYCM